MTQSKPHNYNQIEKSVGLLLDLLDKLGVQSADNIYVGKDSNNIPLWWHAGMVFVGKRR